MRRISVSAEIHNNVLCISGISHAYRTLSVVQLQLMAASYIICDMIVWENTNGVHFTVFIFRAILENTAMSNELAVRLKAHTLFLGRVLYFPIPHSIELRLHIV